MRRVAKSERQPGNDDAGGIDLMLRYNVNAIYNAAVGVTIDHHGRDAGHAIGGCRRNGLVN
jgi:hypothetical protein